MAAHSLDPCGDSLLVMFGGVYNTKDGQWLYRNDTWVYDVAINTWVLWPQFGESGWGESEEGSVL